VAWDDDEEWPKLDDDPEAVERRRKAMSEVAVWRRKALRWAYAVIAILIVVVILVAVYH
jgi:hypothetical protein